jgi:VWFA-related protein
MRGPLALAFLLVTFPLCAQEALLDFAITPGAGRLDLGAVVIPVEISMPADELRFVEDGDRLNAAFSVRSVAGDGTTVLGASYQVHVPRGSSPAGVLTRRYEIRFERGTASVDVVVRDENAQIEGQRSITVDGKEIHVDAEEAARAADASWREALGQADREKKPVVVFFATNPCSRCDTFASASVPHPAIQRRLPAVVFVMLPAQIGEAAEWWQSADPGVAFFDRRGILRARWPMIPDTTDFGIILDSVSAVAADFERAAQLSESNEPDAAELAVASGLGRMGRIADAREALARACASAQAETREGAMVMSAILDANDGRWQEALAALEPIAASAATANIGADAWMAVGAIRRATGSAAEAAQAFTAAAQLLGPDSLRSAEAKKALESLKAGRVPEAVRVLPLPRPVVRGRQVVRTHVGSPAVARVVFFVDGREAARVTRPPFSATLDFGEVPERHVIHAVAFDRKGQEIGRHERVVNSAGETFWLHILTPREGEEGGAVQVSMDVRVPPLQRVRRVVVTWNDAERAVLQAPPWVSTVTVAEGEIGVLGAIAELEDGRTTEDAVVLNARGAMGHADVQLVEFPMTIASRSGATPEIASDRIVVREGGKVRRVASIATAAETPLTIGLLIDVSASMQASLLDVQEAAIGFLESILTPRDRAFVITFDTRARIVQPATADVSRLRRQIMTLRPDGLTAIHDAMVLGLLQFEGIKGRRAMVVFTDGLDLTSEYSAADVRELARRVNVPIHVIASTPGVAARLRSEGPSRNAGPRKEPGHEELAGIARSTGGSSQALDDLGDLGRVYARIEASLRAQILAFVRTDPGTRENEWRPIRVEVKGGDLEVFAPEGYYAAW